MSMRSVSNQVPPLVGHDVSAADPALQAGLAAAGAALTRSCGRWPWTPVRRRSPTRSGWRTGSRPAHPRPGGHRIDEVEYHPAWHPLMARAVAAGLQAAPWAPDAGTARPPAARRRLLPVDPDRVRAPVPDLDDLLGGARAAARTRPGRPVRSRVCAPARTTSGCARRRRKPVCWPGMSMTEKQGGSDLRAGTTAARRRTPRCRTSTG